ncbi:hypothetical protein B4V02_01225 [Paenibacillus kribbensis]|uniref:Uncharacterized protein n=1 Tax=Paenibacillus kribbensis TaxID=172713 RepID=A0A222WH56_9BACL|nr:hypothetical protein B4V02_01225 [Paenibacillus kribbensis]
MLKQQTKQEKLQAIRSEAFLASFAVYPIGCPQNLISSIVNKLEQFCAYIRAPNPQIPPFSAFSAD